MIRSATPCFHSNAQDTCYLRLQYVSSYMCDFRRLSLHLHFCLKCNILRDFFHRVASFPRLLLASTSRVFRGSRNAAKVNTSQHWRPTQTPEKEGCSIKVMFHTQSKIFKRQNCPKMKRGPRLNSKAISTDHKRRQEPIF